MKLSACANFAKNDKPCTRAVDEVTPRAVDSANQSANLPNLVLHRYGQQPLALYLLESARLIKLLGLRRYAMGKTILNTSGTVVKSSNPIAQPHHQLIPTFVQVK